MERRRRARARTRRARPRGRPLRGPASRPCTSTSAPSPASRTAVSRPMPRVAPVTSTVRPSIRPQPARSRASGLRVRRRHGLVHLHLPPRPAAAAIADGGARSYSITDAPARARARAEPTVDPRSPTPWQTQQRRPDHPLAAPRPAARRQSRAARRRGDRRASAADASSRLRVGAARRAAPGRPAARRAGGCGTRSRASTAICAACGSRLLVGARRPQRVARRARRQLAAPAPSSGRPDSIPTRPTTTRLRPSLPAAGIEAVRRPAGEPARRPARRRARATAGRTPSSRRSGAPALRPARPDEPLPAPRRAAAGAGRAARPLARRASSRRPRRRGPPVSPRSGGRASAAPTRASRASWRVRSPTYAADRDRPDLDGSSRLSPHLHWGELTARQVWHAVEGTLAEAGLDLEAAVGPPSWDEEQAPGLRRSAGAFLRQLGWREFAHHLLAAFPHTADAAAARALRGLPLARRPGRARGLAARPHRLPGRGRRHAAALDDRMDAQPRPAARRLVPRQGPAAAVAGRAPPGSGTRWWTPTSRTTRSAGSGWPDAERTRRRTSASSTR